MAVSLPPTTPRTSILDALNMFSQMSYMKQQREAQKLKNAESSIDLGLRELGFTNADNWNEFIDRQVQRGIFDAKYGQSLKAAGYSDLVVEDLRKKCIAAEKFIQYQMEGRRLDQADRRLDQGDRSLDQGDRRIDLKGRGGGGGGGSLGLSMGSGYTDERPSGAGVFAPQSVPSRRSVPTAPSGCSGGTCSLPPVSNLSGGSLSNAMAALPSAGESRSTLNDIFAALKQGYQSTTAQPANTLGMYAAAPSPTMTDAAPAQSPAAPYYEGFYNNPAVTGKGWNFKYSDKMSPRNLNKSAKGAPDIDQFNPVTNEARETMNKALWPSQYVKEGSGYSGKDLASPEYMPEAKDIFEQFALRGMNPNEAAKKTRDFLLSAAQGPKGTKAAGKDAPEGSYDYNSPDWMTTRANDLYIQAAQSRKPISYAEAVARVRAADEADVPPPEPSWTERGRKYIQEMMGVEGKSGEGTKKSEGKKKRYRSVPDGKGGWTTVEIK